MATPSEQRAVTIPTNTAPLFEPRLRGSFNNPRGNVPLYGSLSVRDAIFYVKATVTQLKTIVASAPRHLRNHLPASPTKDMLLETVLFLRTEEAVNIRMNQRSPEESLQELMNLQPDQLKALAVADQPHLAELMTAALQADRRMQPREVHDSADQMIIKVLSWQINAHKSARALQDHSTGMPATAAAASRIPTRATPTRPVDIPTAAEQATPAPRATSATLPAHVMPPPMAVTHPVAQPVAPANALEEIIARLNPNPHPDPHTRKDTESNDEDWQRAEKRHKTHVVPQGFTFGATANIEQTLRHYPGKETSSPSLACKELLGPFITVQFIQGGNNIPTFMQDFKHWRKTANGMPSQAEMEAHTLARIVHTEILMHESPREALEKRPSLEIALRRLFALLYVEEAVNTGKVKDRTSAWQFVHLLHESIPMGTVMCDHIDDAMTQRMSLEKKRIAAIKALEEARATKSPNHQNPRSYNHRGYRRPERNDHQDRHDRRVQHERSGRQ